MSLLSNSVSTRRRVWRSALAGPPAARATGSLGALALLGVLLAASGCVGVSERQSQTAAETPAQAAPAANAPAAAVASPAGALKSCPAGVAPAGDGLIDDFEDGNTQMMTLGARDGYWWTTKDTEGSTLDPSPFAPSDGGAGGSEKALHVSGKIASTKDAWGVGVGANFATQGTYDATRYAGISFKAKVGDKSTKSVRFKIGDVNTHKDGNICTSCWNHFGKDLTLSTDWKEYVVLFSETRQAMGWGQPRPPSITPSQLMSLDWSIGAKGADYDLWVDDVQFVDCK